MAKVEKNTDAYLRVLQFFVEKNGAYHGAKSLMARELGVTRQSVDNWEDTGVPPKYIPKLKKITGMSASDILPEFFS